MEDKVYIHKGREFKLRTKFYVKDIDITNRIDSFLKKFVFEQGIITSNITSKELNEFLHDILIPVDDLEVENNFFEDMEQTDAMEIFRDFFLIYLQLSINMKQSLMKFEEKLKSLVQVLNN